MLFQPVLHVLICSTAASALHARSSLSNDTHPTSIYGQGEPKAGWIEAPNTRGTLDILWSCVFTSFICCWSILCINVPARNATAKTQFKRKCLTALATILAPEATCFTAIGQYVSASQSVKDFAAAGLSGWTMRHAFFADMGGFILQPRDWVQFPINAKQLLWLIEHGYIVMPQVDLAVIRDKNKANGFMRFITALQVTWFCVNIIGRLAEGIALTAIEVTTVAFIYYGLGTMIFWRHKPADIETAEILYTNATMNAILLAGGDAAREPYRQTPLDFASPQDWVWSKYLTHFENATVKRFTSRSVPIDHISSMTTPEIPIWIVRLCFAGVIGNFALFVPSWNFSFPSRPEQLLWRIAMVGPLVSLLGAELVREWVFIIWPSIKARLDSKSNGAVPKSREPLIHQERQEARQDKQDAPAGNINTTRCSKRTVWDRIRNNSPSNHPQLALPLKATLPIWFLCISYLICRAYIIVEGFIELRSLPLSAFKNVEWSSVFPHF